MIEHHFLLKLMMTLGSLFQLANHPSSTAYGSYLVLTITKILSKLSLSSSALTACIYDLQASN